MCIRDSMKTLQLRYRWHQQQMELALRLLANEELDPQAVNDAKDDINYYVESNQDQDFIEDETIYDSLNLQSNEAIAHEVAQYFASQSAADNEDNAEETNTDASKLSKKEQRKLEREAKKAAKLAAKSAPTTASPSVKLEINKSATPSPVLKNESVELSSMKSIPTSASVPNTAKSPNALPQLTSLKSSPPNEQHQDIQGTHTHIHQGQNGLTSSTILKPATVPARPAGELKWSVAASMGLEKDKKSTSTDISTPVSKPSSIVTTPRLGTPVLEKSTITPTSSSSVTAAAVLAAGAAAVHQNNQQFHKGFENNVGSQTPSSILLNNVKQEGQKDQESETNPVAETTNTVEPEIESPSTPSLIEDYESDISDDDLGEDEPNLIPLTPDELKKNIIAHDHLHQEYMSDWGSLLLPSGIQEFIMGVELTKNNLNSNNGRLGGYRRSIDLCEVNRLDPIPHGVNPPTPLDAFRSTQKWDIVRCSLRDVISKSESETEIYQEIIQRFRGLEMFTLFYNYYFAVTPLEKEISNVILNERSWRISKDETLWFLRQGSVKLQNEFCEIGDYKIFKLDDWTVIDKINFKLDYSNLKISSPTTTDSAADVIEESESINQETVSAESDKLSHGQQLLQQLKQGKVGVPV